MDIKYDDLFSDHEKNEKININCINIHSGGTNQDCNNDLKLLGKKNHRETGQIQEIYDSEKNKNKKKNKNNKNNKNLNYSIESNNEKIKENLNNIKENNVHNSNNDKLKTNNAYFMNKKIHINTLSKYDFENSNKSKYQDILGNKKSILKIQEYSYDSHMTNSSINYKVITQIKTINFKTDNVIFQKGRVGKDNNEENYINGQNLVESGYMPSIGFWNQRYYYFSKYDEGIKLDYESWYSVTPEEISIYIAEFCRDKVVLDAFGGCGGNTIQFSKFCQKVFYNELDENKVKYCKNNTNIYNCPDNIEFLNEDFLKLKDRLKADIVFLSPPWGGMDYKSTEYYSLKDWITPDIADILETTLSISENLILYLPRNIEIEELFTILFQTYEKIFKKNNKVLDPTIFCDIHILYSANKAKALLIFIGDLFNNVSARNIRDYLTTFYQKVNNREANEMIEIIKIIGLEEYLEFTNKFYEKLNRQISQKKLDISPAYDKAEFLQLMSFILKKKVKQDVNFLSTLKKNISEKFSEFKINTKDYNNGLIQNILKIYSIVDEDRTDEIMDFEFNLKKGSNNLCYLDEETFNKLKNKKI